MRSMRITSRLRRAGSGSRAGAAKTPGRWDQQWPTSTTEDGARKKGGAVTLERSPETDERNCLGCGVRRLAIRGSRLDGLVVYCGACIVLRSAIYQQDCAGLPWHAALVLARGHACSCMRGSCEREWALGSVEECIALILDLLGTSRSSWTAIDVTRSRCMKEEEEGEKGQQIVLVWHGR